MRAHRSTVHQAAGLLAEWLCRTERCSRLFSAVTRNDHSLTVPRSLAPTRVMVQMPSSLYPRMRAVVSVLLLVAVRPTAAQTFPLTAADVADSAALATSMPRLARNVAASYRGSDRARFLDNLFRLQLVAGSDSAALETLGELAQLRRTRDTTAQGRATNVPHEIYARAMEQSAKDGSTFAAAFARRFARHSSGSTTVRLR